MPDHYLLKERRSHPEKEDPSIFDPIAISGNRKNHVPHEDRGSGILFLCNAAYDVEIVEPYHFADSIRAITNANRLPT